MLLSPVSAARHRRKKGHFIAIFYGACGVGVFHVNGDQGIGRHRFAARGQSPGILRGLDVIGRQGASVTADVFAQAGKKFYFMIWLPGYTWPRRKWRPQSLILPAYAFV
jgi:hypothetical protein